MQTQILRIQSGNPLFVDLLRGEEGAAYPESEFVFALFFASEYRANIEGKKGQMRISLGGMLRGRKGYCIRKKMSFFVKIGCNVTNYVCTEMKTV